MSSNNFLTVVYCIYFIEEFPTHMYAIWTQQHRCYGHLDCSHIGRSMNVAGTQQHSSRSHLYGCNSHQDGSHGDRRGLWCWRNLCQDLAVYRAHLQHTLYIEFTLDIFRTEPNVHTPCTRSWWQPYVKKGYKWQLQFTLMYITVRTQYNDTVGSKSRKGH